MAELHTGRRHIPVKFFNIFSSSANPYTTTTHLYKRETKTVCVKCIFLSFFFFLYTVHSEEVRENYSCRYEVVLTGSNRREHDLIDWHVTKTLVFLLSMSPEETTLMSAASLFFTTLREFR